ALGEQGRVDLDAPVRDYIPGFELADPGVAATIRVIDLLTHTAGWVGDWFPDTGWGDDALARAVDQMPKLRQLFPPGTLWSYNNAAFYVAGRIIEVVTGETYATALRRMVLGPLGLEDTHLLLNDIITRRFAVGHEVTDGAARVVRDLKPARALDPAGGIFSSAADQLRYAR